MLKLIQIAGILAAMLAPQSVPLSINQTVVVRTPPTEIIAVYATANTVHYTPNLNTIRDLLKTTSANAVVINTKEPSGLKLDETLRTLVSELKNDGVWTIARHVVFQDDELTAQQPELALKKSNGMLWRDKGGRTWVDPANQKVWQANLTAALQEMDYGFDEINLDYIRFPTDGNLKSIVYPTWNAQLPKEDVITNFVKWFGKELKIRHPQVVISIDVFGDALLKDWDAGLGQRIKKLAPQVDVIAPMVYPSHYATMSFGFKNPAEHPYEIVYESLTRGRELMTDSPTTIMRPWLQDFNLGARYTEALVRAQIKATKDAGFNNGFMLWNAKNIYTKAALVEH